MAQTVRSTELSQWRDAQAAHCKGWAANPDAFSTSFFTSVQRLLLIPNNVQCVQVEAAKNASKTAENPGNASTSIYKGQSQPNSGLKLSEEEKLKRAQAEEREKRAAAAERRLAALKIQGGGATNVPSTSEPKSGAAGDIYCSCCNTSLAGKVPFRRYNYKYCSTSCMHVHREILEDE